MSFQTFLENKPLYYKEIDHERVHIAYSMIKGHIQQPLTIHIVGTNGKGSTGRIMATLLHEAGKSVGHFSSPHILKFNERIWIEGNDSSDELLQKAHEKLYTLLGKEMSDALSYFEYTTLLFLVATEHLDVIVLEAGLGGEFDATNVVSKALSVITPIGLDHQDFLGNSIESIATTKLNSIEHTVLVSFQPNKEVYAIAEAIAQKKRAKLYMVDTEINSEIVALAETLEWADYLIENAALAIKALDILELPYHVKALKKVKLFGRFYPLSKNITIDVGHNLLAAERVVLALLKKYGTQNIVLVYNALDDKDYASILRLFSTLVKRVEIISIATERAVEREKLETVLNQLDIEHKEFNLINSDEEYIVFGSFYVVEAFLNIKNK